MSRTTKGILQALLLMLLSGLPPTYAQQTEKAKAMGGRLLCLCGCNQILTACNHVGCSMSTEMLKKLDQ